VGGPGFPVLLLKCLEGDRFGFNENPFPAQLPLQVQGVRYPFTLQGPTLNEKPWRLLHKNIPKFYTYLACILGRYG
jgi:hypothetical protein